MRYKNTVIVFAAVFICVLLFTSVSIFSLTNMAKMNTQEINTMITYRLYDEISNSLNGPLTVGNTMVNNRTVIEFLENDANLTEEEAVEQIQPYLQKITDTFGYETANIISEKSHRYYTNVGFNKTIDPENDEHDIWYKNFIDLDQNYLLNVDTDEVNQKQWTLFYDFRIEDENGDLLGVCSVGMKMSRLQPFFAEAEKNYGVKANLVDKNGIVQVDIDDINIEKLYVNTSFIDQEEQDNNVHINFDNNDVVISKFVESIGWYLVVRGDVNNFNEDFKKIIAVNVIISLVITIIVLNIIVIIMRRSEKKNLLAERMSKQLAATADIYISMHEINFLNDTFSEVRNKKSEASEMIGEKRSNCQEMIRKIMTKFSDESSRADVLDFVDFSKLDKRLKDRETITIEWLSDDKKWRKSRFIVSERTPTGMVARAMYLIEDIDAEKLKRDKMLNTAQQLGFQIRSIANIYTSVHDVDIVHDSFAPINITDSVVENIIGQDINNAQQVMIHAMEQLTDESCKKDVLEFVDFKNVEKNLAETRSAAIEFLNSRGFWCRGRFIVSERTEDGRLSHVIWAVENIDSEKREREKLTEGARALADRISSIANIFMTVHELDIKSKEVTEIKSRSAIVNDLLGSVHTDPQGMLRMVMENVTDASSYDDVMNFIDLSTLDRRLTNKDTIAVEYLNKQGLWRRGRFVASRRDEKGHLTRILWLSEDIDSEKRERDELIDASERAIAANEAQSAFLSNMSDKLRTPINTVLDTNEIILGRSTDTEITRCANIIRETETDLLGLVTDILDFSKIETGKIELVSADYDLSVVIESLVEMIKPKAEAKGLRFEVETDRRTPRFLNGDKEHLMRIISNLLTNAVKYTDKGTVTFCVRYEKIPDEQDAVMLTVIVKDTGTGIPKEDMRKLFSGLGNIEEERNRKASGMGLGMSITKHLLEMMDSTLVAESIYGLGSKFSFELRQTVVNWDALGDGRSEV